MDTRTGHLIDRDQVDDRELRSRDLDPGRYTPVPRRHRAAARRALAGRPETRVSLSDGGTLSTWAAQQQRRDSNQARRRKVRRKMARKSRKKNRRRR